jgi:hypothetical protein
LTTRRGNLFKPRKSIIDKGSQAIFWGISSFKDTFLWTEEQKHDVIEQAYWLVKHYIKVIKKHLDMFTQIQDKDTWIKLLNDKLYNLR